MNTQTKGQKAEDLACEYLKKQGLRFITRNFRSRFGEIDLILRDKTVLVFVEVRSRSSMAFGGAIASVTLGKQQKIVKTAQFYLVKHGLQDKMPVRFDVVALEGKSGQINWIKQAFGADVLAYN